MASRCITPSPLRGPCTEDVSARLPDLAVGQEQQPGQQQHERHHAEAEPLALFQLGLGCPGQERDDVLRFLVDRRLVPSE